MTPSGPSFARSDEGRVPMNDPMTLVAGTATVAAAVFGLGWAYAASTIRDMRLQETADLNLIRSTTDKLDAAEARLGEYEAKEAARRSNLSKAGKAGRAKQIATASETKAERARLANLATARTMAELSKTNLRSRAQVVAPVKAKRTKAKKAAATA